MSPAEYIASWTKRMEEIEKMLQRHNRDLYEGNGISNPSITTRLFRVEDSLSTLLSNSKWIVRLVIGTFIIGIIGMILHFVKP